MIAGNLWYRKIDSSTAVPPCQSLVPNGCGSIHIASSLPLIGVYRSFLMTLLFLIGGYRYVLFSQCRSRDDIHGNNFFDTSSSARANVYCEEDKRKLTLRLCLHYTEPLFVPTWKTLRHSVNINGPNLSDTWRFTFKIEAAQRRSVVKTAPKLVIPLWTEALSDMVFVSAHKLSGIV